MPTPFTPACDGHPLAPIAGLIRVHGAEPGDAVVVELLDIAPSGEGITALLLHVAREHPPRALAAVARGAGGRSRAGEEETAGAGQGEPLP